MKKWMRQAQMVLSYAGFPQLASSTPRLALAPQVQRMQSVLRETQTLPIEGCLLPAHRAIVEGMKEIVRAYLAFMRQESGDPYFDRATTLIKAAHRRIDACVTQSQAM